MNHLALLCSAFLAASGPGDSGPNVRELVSALDDDSIERREKAAAELLGLGEPAVRALWTTLEASLSPEARGRLGDVLYRLDAGRRRRESRGGEVQDGLSAAVRIADRDPSMLRLEIEITNVGEKDTSFFPVRWWNLSLPEERFVSNLSEGTLEIRQLSGKPCGEPARGRLCVPGPHRRTPLLLGPGESRTYEFRLDSGTLPEGEYSIQFEYHSSGLLGTPKNLRSNALGLKIGN